MAMPFYQEDENQDVSHDSMTTEKAVCWIFRSFTWNDDELCADFLEFYIHEHVHPKTLQVATGTQF